MFIAVGFITVIVSSFFFSHLSWGGKMVELVFIHHCLSLRPRLIFQSVDSKHLLLVGTAMWKMFKRIVIRT